MSLREQYIALMTLLRKEIRRFLRIWPQTLLPSAITMSLYFVIFGSLIGSRIGDMGGFRYMEFVVPGLIMMAIVTNSYSNVVSSFFGSKFNHSVEELLVSPTPNYVILLGFLLGGIARGLLVALIVTAVSLFFTRLPIYSIGIVALVVLFTSTLFALAGFVHGVFYSLDLLPEFWAGVSKLNPLVYVVNAFRYGVLGVSDVNVGFAFAMIAGFTVLLFFYAMHLLSSGKRLRQ